MAKTKKRRGGEKSNAMTTEETIKSILQIRAFFPRSQELDETTIEFYHQRLKDYDYEVVCLAIGRCLDTSKWEPTIHCIKEAIIDIQSPEERLPTPSQAWALSTPFLTYCGGIKPDRKTIPPIVRRSWKGLPCLGQEATTQDVSYLRRDFIEAYKEEVRRTRIKLATPVEEQNRIKQIQEANYTPLLPEPKEEPKKEITRGSKLDEAFERGAKLPNYKPRELSTEERKRIVEEAYKNENETNGRLQIHNN